MGGRPLVGQTPDGRGVSKRVGRLKDAVKCCDPSLTRDAKAISRV
jgi:hypothetical protein